MTLLAGTHHEPESQNRSGPGDLLDPAPTPIESQRLSGGVEPLGQARTLIVDHLALGLPDLSGYQELRIWAESFEDAQKARISCVNRMERGGVDPDLFMGQIDALNAAEHQLQLALGRCYRRVVDPSIIAWQKATFGIGSHLLARHLGTLGHPRIATPSHWEGDGADRKLIPDMPFERTVRQLWSYCGHGDATRKRRKGMSADDALALGNPRLKMLTHLLAESAIKCRIPNESAVAGEGPGSEGEPTAGPQANGTPARPNRAETPNGNATPERTAASRHLRQAYDQARITYATREDWSLGHQHNAALRLVGKQLLADLWEAAGS